MSASPQPRWNAEDIDAAHRAARSAADTARKLVAIVGTTHRNPSAQNTVTIASILNDLGNAAHRLAYAATTAPEPVARIAIAVESIRRAAAVAARALHEPGWNEIREVCEVVTGAADHVAAVRVLGLAADVATVGNPPVSAWKESGAE